LPARKISHFHSNEFPKMGREATELN